MTGGAAVDLAPATAAIKATASRLAISGRTILFTLYPRRCGGLDDRAEDEPPRRGCGARGAWYALDAADALRVRTAADGPCSEF
jgi:hypothetical protein